MPLAKPEFDYLRQLVLDRSAIALDESKEYLLEMRLSGLVRLHNFESVGALAQHLKKTGTGSLHAEVVDAMTTNETSFFRDLHPFETLKRSIFPEFLAKRASSKALNLWCAACSSGQEPYTIAMLLKANFPQLQAGWNLQIRAGDLSPTILNRAREGLYTQLEINRGLPAPLLIKYFSKDGSAWRLNQEIRDMVKFHELNLAKAFPPLPQMDIIFLRNVLIYFDLETKRQILAKVRRLIRPDGILFLGGAETTINVDDQWERVQDGKTVYYRLRQNA
jgi:chemotaxis protein methyltransferase CheR